MLSELKKTDLELKQLEQKINLLKSSQRAFIIESCNVMKELVNDTEFVVTFSSWEFKKSCVDPHGVLTINREYGDYEIAIVKRIKVETELEGLVFFRSSNKLFIVSTEMEVK